jgi:RNA polymerase sigma factor (sigma-70 family)
VGGGGASSASSRWKSAPALPRGDRPCGALAAWPRLPGPFTRLPAADRTWDDALRRTEPAWNCRMRRCVNGSPSIMTRRRSTSSSSGTRAAPTGWRGRSCAMRRRRGTSRRRRSSGCSSRRAASAGARGSRRGSTGCWSTSAWTSGGRPGGGGRSSPGRTAWAALLDRQPGPSVDPVEGLSKERDTERLWAAVGGLSPQQRAVVTLQAQEELSTKEIAAILKCSEATVRVHLHRALSTLRRTMGNG